MRTFLLALSLILGAVSTVGHAQTSRVPKPAIVIEKSGRCVADTDTMRREHMNLLRHQRDSTVREGVRTTQYSLNGCIDCHASSKSGSVVGAKDSFCQGCHAYVGLKLDCFECHAGKVQGNNGGSPFTASLRRVTRATEPERSAP